MSDGQLSGPQLSVAIAAKPMANMPKQVRKKERTVASMGTIQAFGPRAGTTGRVGTEPAGACGTAKA